MSLKIKTVKSCRVCGSLDLKKVFDLGSLSITGVFIKPTDLDPLRAPICLVFCKKCTFLQVQEEVDPDVMYDSYWYRSGTNNTMKNHLKNVVESALIHASIKNDDYVLDIGCNDGTLLKQYPDFVRKIGVDPSNAINDILDHDVIKVNDYFSAKNVKDYVKGRKVKIITSISMFYDLSDPKSFLNDIFNLLDDSGIWVLEMNYTANMVSDLGFDMISHEHVGYYTLKSFVYLLTDSGLFVNNVSFNKINGGSIRIFCSKKDFRAGIVDETILKEESMGLDRPETFEDLKIKIDDYIKKINEWLQIQVEQGKKIALYGASTRCNTILQYGKIGPDLVYGAAERNPDKYGLVTSGSRIPIFPEKKIREDNPDYFFVGPYYFLEEFIEREDEYLERGGRFFVPLPQPRIIHKVDGKLKVENI